MLQSWDLSWVFPSSMLDLFTQWRAPSTNQVIKRLWSYTLLHLVWGIWKERNNRISRDLASSVEIVFHKIHICTEYDHKMASAWQIQLDIARFFKPLRKPCEISYWLEPPLGWVKLNFDGATKSNPGLVGCGGVIRGSNGTFISEGALPLGSQTNHIIKAIGAFQILLIAKQKKKSKVWIEGTPIILFNVLKEKSNLHGI